MKLLLQSLTIFCVLIASSCDLVEPLDSAPEFILIDEQAVVDPQGAELALVGLYGLTKTSLGTPYLPAMNDHLAGIAVWSGQGQFT